MDACISATDNTAVGHNALGATVTGAENTTVGRNVLLEKLFLMVQTHCKCWTQ